MEKEYINIEPIKVQEEDLKLVYVNPVGETHNGSQKLEFIFSNNPDDCIGPQWEDICDLGVYPPRKGFIKKVIEVTSDSIEFDCLVDSGEFRMLDAVFGVIALAWEYVEDYRKMSSLNKSLIVFRYGDSYYDVREVLRNNDIKFED
jgi:hypothetical protein